MTVTCSQVDSVEVATAPEMASLLQEMGVRYNPRRLASALRGRQLEVNARALRITYTLGKFIASLAKVGRPARALSSQQHPSYPEPVIMALLETVPAVLGGTHDAESKVRRACSRSRSLSENVPHRTMLLKIWKAMRRYERWS